MFPQSKNALVISRSCSDVVCFFRPTLDCLFLITLSATLSAFVPKNKCDGFVHSLLSHRCNTCNPIGIAPKCISQDARCANNWALLLAFFISPYPYFVLLACQHQQPSFFSTLSKKRICNGARFPVIKIRITNNSQLCNTKINQLKCKRVTGIVSTANVRAQRTNEKLGWKRETTLSDYFPDGDGIVYCMRRDECRWLGVTHELLKKAA